MTKKEKFENRIICCDTCQNQVRLDCSNKIYCFNTLIGHDKITKFVNGKKWSAVFPNMYEEWKAKYAYLDDELFEI